MKNQLVKCGHHGVEPGYCVCLHVFNKETSPWHVIRATTEVLGESLCKACVSKELTADDLRLICETCARENGFLSLIQ